MAALNARHKTSMTNSALCSASSAQPDSHSLPKPSNAYPTCIHLFQLARKLNTSISRMHQPGNVSTALPIVLNAPYRTLKRSALVALKQRSSMPLVSAFLYLLVLLDKRLLPSLPISLNVLNAHMHALNAMLTISLMKTLSDAVLVTMASLSPTSSVLRPILLVNLSPRLHVQ